MTAVIPPGRFATLPSLRPGRYAFVATNADARAPVAEGAGGGTPRKGTIVVEPSARTPSPESR